MTIARINVAGTVYEVDTDLFNGRLEDTMFQERLPHDITEAANTGSTLTYQRPVASFVAILEYYQTGELHMPNGVCPFSFKKELDFFKIEVSGLQECCRIKFRCFVEEQNLLREFRQDIRGTTKDKVQVQALTMRQKVWAVVDHRGTSMFAKIYFGVSMVAVVACILGITLGTDSCCMREATFCELVEYVSYTDKPLFNALNAHIKNLRKCDVSLFDHDTIPLPKSVIITQDKISYYITIFVKKPNAPPEISPTSSTVATSTPSNPPTSPSNQQTTPNNQHTPPSNQQTPPNKQQTPPNNQPTPPSNQHTPPTNQQTPPTKQHTPPSNAPTPPSNQKTPPSSTSNQPTPPSNQPTTPSNQQAPPPGDQQAPDDPSDDEYSEYTVRKLFLKDNGIVITEYATLVFFTLDFLVRLGTCPSIPQFMKSTLNIIDFAALVGSILNFSITIIRKDQKYETNWVDMLGFIQVFRALRLFRLVKNIRTSRVLAFSIRRNAKGMSILIVFILIFVCTFGSLIFFVEDNLVVPSILDGWWWSIVTLSTVGYGDIVPETPMGRAAGSICAITGIWLLSMTLPIFVNDFVLLHQFPYSEEDDNDAVINESSNVDPHKTEAYVVRKTDGDDNRVDAVNKVRREYDGGVMNAWVSLPEKEK